MSDPRYVPWASSEAVRKIMVGNKAKDTGPELALRSVLHRRGFRYRLDVRPLPTLRRRADLVFRKARVAVFVDGCYWHGCSEHYAPPAMNAEYWASKIERNKLRDQETDRLLLEAGWLPVRVWEHEPVEAAAERVVEVLRAARGLGVR